MQEMDTLYAEYEVMKAAMRLIASASDDKDDFTACRLAMGLQEIHDRAGLADGVVFWGKVWCLLRHYQDRTRPFQIRMKIVTPIEEYTP